MDRGERTKQRASRIAAGLLAAAMLLGACDRPAPRGTLLRDVQIIDLENGRVIASQSVRVMDGTIVEIGPEDELDAPAAKTIEGNGGYLLPGLIDAHVHVDHPDELTLYPAYGVTSAIVLRGVPHHLQWRAEVRTGRRFGPDLYLNGDYFDGLPAWMEPMLALEDAAAARRAVRRQLAEGYDFIKVFTQLSPEQLTAITDEARTLGACVMGHGGRNYDLAHLIDAGQANLAHAQDLIRWYLDGPEDEEGIRRFVEQLAASQVTVTANLAFTEGLLRQGRDLEALLATDEARWLHPAVLQPFRRVNNRYVRNAEQWVPEVAARLEVEMRVARMLNEAGVTLLAGTDASTSGVFPGESMLRELGLLVEAGLTPLDSLRTATVNAGNFLERCLGTEKRVGRIATGFAADLLLLASNPLEDIGALREVAGVMLNGRWFAREQLHENLLALERDYREWGHEVEALEQAIFAGDAVAAREIFDRVRDARPGEFVFSQYVPFFVGYGFLYGENGFSDDPERLAMAEALYEMYVETYPDYHSGHYMLGLARRANGDDEGARASLLRALEIHPDYTKAREQLVSLPPEPAE